MLFILMASFIFGNSDYIYKLVTQIQNSAFDY